MYQTQTNIEAQRRLKKIIYKQIDHSDAVNDNQGNFAINAPIEGLGVINDNVKSKDSNTAMTLMDMGFEKTDVMKNLDDDKLAIAKPKMRTRKPKVTGGNIEPTSLLADINKTLNTPVVEQPPTNVKLTIKANPKNQMPIFTEKNQTTGTYQTGGAIKPKSKAKSKAEPKVKFKSKAKPKTSVTTYTTVTEKKMKNPPPNSTVVEEVIETIIENAPVVKKPRAKGKGLTAGGLTAGELTADGLTAGVVKKPRAKGKGLTAGVVKKPNPRNIIVKKIMNDMKLSLIEASKYVKANNLYQKA